MKLNERIPDPDQLSQSLNEVVSNRRFIMSSIGGFIVVLILFGGVMLWDEVSAQNSAKAWDSYVEVLDLEIADKTPEEMQTYVDTLNGLLKDLAGTPVEPWILKDAADTHFNLRQVPKARELYQDLEKRYPNHAVSIGLKFPLTPDQQMDTVRDALEDCPIQEEFLAEHPDPPKPEEKDDSGPSEGDKDSSSETE